MAAWVWVIIAIAVVVVVVLVAAGARNRRTALLRNRFGPEYDRAVENSDDRRAAESELRARERQRAQFDVKPLPEATRLQFAGEWRALQEHFLDQPAEAVDGADSLITRVMEARDYPMKDFDAQVELVSVDHPDTVENYRFAHGVRERAQTQQASTEDLREALLRYRSLFDDLLRPEGSDAAGVTADQTQPANSGRRQRVAAEPEAQDRAEAAVAAGRADGPVRGESDDVDPAVSDTSYDEQTTGRREGR